ncbi:MAG: AbrB family transcriptional regulator [Rhizobiales bacterium]|nr:AbrB family transcriptional regulator [Hyphomicrobiales bacterium]
MPSPPVPPIGLWPRPVQWGVLLALSAALGAALFAAGLPAALLLGPMLAAIAIGVAGGSIRVADPLSVAAQAIVGMLIASALSPDIIGRFRHDWPLFLAVVASTIVASSLLGYLMSRRRIVPGTTAVWGSSPGAASAMVLMADAFGADARLVALMQYLRVVMIAGTASVIAGFFVDLGTARPPPIVWFPPLEAHGFGLTLAVAVVGALFGQRLPIPSGAMLVPMIAGAALSAGGLISIQLPEWLLSIGYALIGWRIGLGFTRAVVQHALRILPHLVASIMALIAFCAGLAMLLVRFAGVDPLTAYLATSPGGMDSIAIIAAASPVDVSFVMSLQVLRFFLIVLFGPAIATFIARRL